MDLTTAQRLAAASDPKALTVLKSHRDDPAAAKAVAGRFAALLMQNIIEGSDGAALPLAGDGIGGNIVSGLFASAISQAAASGDKHGLADTLFRSIEAKQPSTAAGADSDRGATENRAGNTAGGGSRAGPAGGLPLDAYWRGNGLRPVASATPPMRRTPIIAAAAGASTDPGAGHLTIVATANPPAPMPMSIGSTPPVGNALPGSSAPAAQVQSFVRQLRPALMQAGRQLGVSPRILLAHAALETGWGRSVVGNNLFGIKAGASWQGAAVTTPTHEVEDGVRVPRAAAFRAYPSLDASVQDYVALIGGNPRYQGLIGLGDDVEAYGRALVAGGYATDTAYGRKLEAVAADAAAAFAMPSGPTRLELFASPGVLE